MPILKSSVLIGRLVTRFLLGLCGQYLRELVYAPILGSEAGAAAEAGLPTCKHFAARTTPASRLFETVHLEAFIGQASTQ